MNPRVLTQAGMYVVVLLALIYSVTAFMTVPIPSAQSYGLLFPSPSEWPLIPIAGEALNLVIIAVSTFLVYLTNKGYSLVRTSQPLWASFYLALACGNVLISGHLTAAPVVTGILQISIAPMLGSYRSRNATHEYFFIATCLAVGAMFQQAFILFLLAIIGSGFIMKSLGFKELCAIGLGLVAPYWVIFGLGLVSPLEIHWPVAETIFTGHLDQAHFVMTVGAGAGLLAGLVLALNNGIKLYAGNAGVRSYNNVINVFGLIAVAGIILDVNNATAYTGVFALWLSNQLAHLFTLWKFGKPRLIYWLIQATIGASALLLLLNA